jgi:hypothetical protein
VEGRFGMTRGLEKRFTRLVAISSPLFFEFLSRLTFLTPKLPQIFGFLFPFGVVLTTGQNHLVNDQNALFNISILVYTKH